MKTMDPLWAPILLLVCMPSQDWDKYVRELLRFKSLLFKLLFAAERESPSAGAYRYLHVEADSDKQTQSSPGVF